MIEYIIIGVFVLVVAGLVYAVKNLLHKVEVYEDQMNAFEEWSVRFRSEADKLYKNLKMVDDKELFVKDEDVGFVFSEILRVTKEFDDNVQ